jgi:hemerythrin superfamily protein
MATNPMTSAGQDVLELLRQDHLKVDELFGRYADATDNAEKLHVVQQIYLELLPHAQAEEELFYPALRDAGSDEAGVEEAYSEHDAAKKTIESILAGSPDDVTFDMKVKMLQKEIQHHVREEETELFQEARDSGLDLSGLAQRIAQRKQELRPMFEQQLNAAAQTPGM